MLTSRCTSCCAVTAILVFGEILPQVGRGGQNLNGQGVHWRGTPMEIGLLPALWLLIPPLAAWEGALNRPLSTCPLCDLQAVCKKYGLQVGAAPLPAAACLGLMRMRAVLERMLSTFAVQPLGASDMPLGAYQIKAHGPRVRQAMCFDLEPLAQLVYEQEGMLVLQSPNRHHFEQYFCWSRCSTLDPAAQPLFMLAGPPAGAYLAVPVRILMFVTGPVTWPISKLLDWILGEESALFRQAGRRWRMCAKKWSIVGVRIPNEEAAHTASAQGPSHCEQLGLTNCF